AGRSRRSSTAIGGEAEGPSHSSDLDPDRHDALSVTRQDRREQTLRVRLEEEQRRAGRAERPGRTRRGTELRVARLRLRCEGPAEHPPELPLSPVEIDGPPPDREQARAREARVHLRRGSKD